MDTKGHPDLMAVGYQAYGLAADGAAPAAGTPPSARIAGLPSWGVLVRLVLLSVGQPVQLLGLMMMAPLISASIGVWLRLSTSAFGVQLEYESVLGVVGAIAAAAVTVRWRQADRGRILRWAALVWALLMVAGSFLVAMQWALIGLVLLGGACWGVSITLVLSLLAESFPAELRPRAFCWFFAGQALTGGIVLLVVAYLASPTQWTWRAGLLAAGVAMLACTVCAGRVRDPGVGAQDAQVMAAAARNEAGTAPAPPDAASASLWEGFRQALSVGSMSACLQLFVAFGLFIAAMHLYAGYVLQDRFGLTAAGATLALAVGTLIACVALGLLGLRRPGRDRQGAGLRVAGLATLVGAVAFAVGASVSSLPAAVVLLAVTWICAYLALPGAAVPVFTAIHPQQRVRWAALLLTAVCIGVLVGGPLAQAFQARFGTTSAVIVLAIAGAGLSVASLRRHNRVDDDTKKAITVLASEAQYAADRASGATIPLLTCEHVDFAYGSLQVLFDVGIRVDDGEMVALLGTNGAGKSTLLRAISGLGYPSGGVIRYRGSDITYLAPTSRVGLGISQVPGGRAVFGPMSVVDNLRVYGYSLGRRRPVIDQKIEEVFETFTQLQTRRNQPAATLSGGEQQMLALGKAMILRPRLLLIDELSLGLAPIVTAALLRIVRTINERGTAVVLVEQSVDIALTLAHRAYFMEKGQIRFDGAAADLLARDDILRAVFFVGHGADAGSSPGDGRVTNAGPGGAESVAGRRDRAEGRLS
jgi:ABC-type branched-subunit amino acid transport system ATPase component